MKGRITPGESAKSIPSKSLFIRSALASDLRAPSPLPLPEHSASFNHRNAHFDQCPRLTVYAYHRMAVIVPRGVGLDRLAGSRLYLSYSATAGYRVNSERT